MKLDASLEIRQHYISLLSGISYNSRVVPVINLAKVFSKLPYILVFGVSVDPANTKNSYNDNVTVTIQVHTEFSGNFGGEKAADTIVNEIINKRYPENKPGDYGETNNFKIVTCTHQVNESARVQNTSSVQIIKTITFNHYISQK